MWAKVILTMVVETCTWMQRLKIEEYDGLTVHTWEIVMKYFKVHSMAMKFTDGLSNSRNRVSKGHLQMCL